MAVVMKIIVFWDVVLYSVVKAHSYFGGTYCSILGYNPEDRSSKFFRNVRKFLHFRQNCSINTLRRTKNDLRFRLMKCSDLSYDPCPFNTESRSVSNFGGILFTPISYTAVAC